MVETGRLQLELTDLYAELVGDPSKSDNKRQDAGLEAKLYEQHDNHTLKGNQGGYSMCRACGRVLAF